MKQIVTKLIFGLLITLVGVFSLTAQESIHDLARNGDLTKIKAFVENDATIVNLQSEQGFSPLLLAVYYEKEEVANYLIENGATVNEDSAMGSPLMAAVVKNNYTLTEKLLAKGADVNATDANGTTSLIYAVTFQLEDIVDLLLKHNPNILLKDEKGFSAIDYAEKLPNKAIENKLKN